MRAAVAMLAILATGALSCVLADPPVEAPAGASPATAPAPSQAAPSREMHEKMATPGVPDPAAAERGAQRVATAAETPAVAPSQPAAGDSDERLQERLLRNQGYRPTMVHGEEKYCRREAPLGSRLATVMHCVTLAEAEEMARDGQDTTERLQRSMLGCLTPAAGGCGH